MVLNRSGREAGFCTATVLAPTVVVTAAHCVPQGADLRVHYPEPGQAPALLPVAAVARHPGYRPDAIRRRERSIDLALIRLDAPLPTRFVPASIDLGSGAGVGATFAVSGYGLAREGDGASSGRLRSVTLAARSPLSDLLLWAEDPRHGGGGACTGDSGAPVVNTGSTRIAAIVVWSSGRGGQRCGDLTQALWLAPQRGWIDGVLRGWSAER